MRPLEPNESLGKNIFNRPGEEPRESKGERQAGVELTRLDRIDGLTGNPELFRKIGLAPIPLRTEKA